MIYVTRSSSAAIKSKPTASIGYSDAALQRDLDRLQRAWQTFQSSRRRNAVYKYLNGVFDLVSAWAAEGRAIGRARRALKVQPGVGGMYLEPFAAVLYWTTNGKATDKKARSKWARVLRYAAR